MYVAHCYDVHVCLVCLCCRMSAYFTDKTGTSVETCGLCAAQGAAHVALRQALLD